MSLNFPKPPAWTEDALCAQVDPDLWFPESGGAWQFKAAKAICDRCPVQTDCLQYAIDNHEVNGVWGGTTDMSRRRAAGRAA